MLVFAKGKPLGPGGLDWLKIHLVNLTGLKKRFANYLQMGKIFQKWHTCLNTTKLCCELHVVWIILMGWNCISFFMSSVFGEIMASGFGVLRVYWFMVCRCRQPNRERLEFANAMLHEILDSADKPFDVRNAYFCRTVIESSVCVHYRLVLFITL